MLSSNRIFTNVHKNIPYLFELGHQEIIYLTGQKQESAFIQEGAPYLVYLIPLKKLHKN